MGISVVIIPGATYQYDHVEVFGEYAKVGNYQSTFYGVLPAWR